MCTLPPATGSGDIRSHNYGIVIDAGSSGSKVQLFHWPQHDGDPSKLLKIDPLADVYGSPLLMKVEPGGLGNCQTRDFNSTEIGYTVGSRCLEMGI